MKIVKGTQQVQIETPFNNVRELLQHSCKKYPHLDAYWFHSKDGKKTIKKSYQDVLEDIFSYGVGLIELGIAQDLEHISVIGANSYPWVISHNATLFGLGIAVPLDKQLADLEVVSLCERGKVSILVCDYDHISAAKAVAISCPKVKKIVIMDNEEEAKKLAKEDAKYIAFEEIIEKGRSVRRKGAHEFETREIDEYALASILFTSGTTSQSKGVMLSQHNTISNVKQGITTIEIKSGGRALSVLPLHHTFEGSVGMYDLWAVGVCICINENLRTFTKNLKEWKINMLLAVPLLFQGIYRSVQKAIDKTGKRKKIEFGLKLSRFLLKLGIDRRRKIFKPILDQFGGEVDFFVSGAAALAPDVQEFFNDIGILTVCGYGLTETSPILTACSPHFNRIGSSGKVMNKVTVAIDGVGTSEETAGEILAKGDNIMLGYYENEEATKEAFSDGWFRTGDIGYFDKDDFIYITGRAKSMIVLANGKKVFPEELEAILGETEGFKASMVWGEDNQRGSVDLALRLQIDRDSLPEDIAVDSEAEITAYIANVIKQFNSKMTTYKQIKYFFWDDSEPIMTTTLKVKRNDELKRIKLSMKSASISSLEEIKGKYFKLLDKE